MSARISSSVDPLQLSTAMKTKMGAGAQLFDVWMKQESDTIQALARSYGERVCLDEFLRVLSTVKDTALRYLAFTTVL